MLQTRQKVHFAAARLLLYGVVVTVIQWPPLIWPILTAGCLLLGAKYFARKFRFAERRLPNIGSGGADAAGVREPRPPNNRPPQLKAAAELPVA